jgi:hypothetical protein
VLVAGAFAATSGAQSIPGAVLAKNEPHHHRVYEDSTLRVLRVRVPAHDTTLLHEHDPAYFWIALGASEVVNAKLGAPDATIKSSDLSIHYTPGKFAHVARNPGTVPFDNITVEILAPQTNVRNLCEDALASSPKRCPQSDRNEHPAFETDQMRVSLVTIEPGAAMRVGAAKPRWLIALDTNDTHGALQLSRGHWTGGVYRAVGTTWVVSNRGKRAVRVLAVQ